VYALTGRPAELIGITDRGRLDVGRPADVVVFDPDTVGTSVPRRVQDLPGGAERLVTDAYGIDAVIVNGRVIRLGADDQFGPDDALPGVLLRSGAAPLG
jgi:N-acyl-D-aspartate/D-glutamate deacylase